MGDEVSGLNTSGGRRGVINRRDNFDKALFLRDFDAQTAKFTTGLNPHVAGVIGGQIAGVRIQRGQHAVDGGFDQIAFVHLFDILNTDAFKNVAKQVKLFIDVSCAFGFLCQERSGHLRGDQKSCQDTARCGGDEFLHCLSILIRLEPDCRIHGRFALSDFYIERFWARIARAITRL